jgi:arylsulfatase A-like enzyme
MRLISVFAILGLTVALVPSGAAQSASLTVTGKTPASVSLSWAGWDMAGAVRRDLYRNDLSILTWSSDNSKVTHTDTGVAWGTTYSYFLRLTFADSSTRDTNTVWVTTPTALTPLNVVLIVTDDQRADTLQYMPYVQDLLVQYGVTFTSAFASSPQCCPSRSGVLTGLWSHNHGVLSNRMGARYFRDASTLATWLKAAGYRTALIGKYLNRYSGDPCRQTYGFCFRNLYGVFPWPYLPPGWDEWKVFSPEGYYGYQLIENGSTVAYGTAEADYSTTVLQAKAVDFIQTTPADQPFLLVFTPYGPHRPATAAKPDRYLHSGIPPWRPPSWNEADVSDKPTWVQALPVMDAAAAAALDGFRRSQLDTLRSIDRAVKAIYDAVAAAGRLDRTVFIFTSDNGHAWGEHRWAEKMCAYDECSKVPLVIHVPGGSPRTDGHLISLVDLAPSIAAWTGAGHPKVDGISIARRVIDRAAGRRADLLIEMLDGETNDPSQQVIRHAAIRTPRYLYVEYLNGDREFYDVSVDPHFLVNIASDPGSAEIIALLKARLDYLRSK